MNPLALGILDERPMLRRLILAWRSVVLPKNPNWPKDPWLRVRVANRWARAAGMAPFEVRHCWRTIFSNGFATLDGAVNPLAERYCLSQILDSLPASARERLAS